MPLGSSLHILQIDALVSGLAQRSLCFDSLFLELGLRFYSSGANSTAWQKDTEDNFTFLLCTFGSGVNSQDSTPCCCDSGDKFENLTLVSFGPCINFLVGCGANTTDFTPCHPEVTWQFFLCH